MKKRKHFFKVLNRNVITISDQIEMFEDYALCFKKNQLDDPNRMYSWCEKTKLESKETAILFGIAGIETKNENGDFVLLPITMKSASIDYPVNEWYFEQYK